jgi:hypothetical protein
MSDAKETAALPAVAAGPALAPERLVRLALGFYAALLAGALLWRGLADGVLPWRASAAEPTWPLAVRVAAGLAFGAALIGVSRLWTASTAVGRRVSAELAALVRGVSGRQALLLAGVSGLAEEAFFRGALQSQLGLLAASALFGLAHFHPRPSLRPWSLSAALAGLGFGWLFAASGDLVAPALAHFLVNAVNLRWLGRAEPDAFSAHPGTARP